MFVPVAVFASLVKPPLNIILIYSDDHARQAISAYGSPYIQTPNLDRLASDGIKFTRHYSTNPICAPSRAAVLTGKYSHKNGQRDNATTFDGHQVTLPKHLQSAGYETAVLGKWHLVSNPTGFDKWEVLIGQGQYYRPVFETPSGKVTVPGYTTEVITQKAIDFLRAKRQKPFFLMVGHKAPHRNWVPNVKNATLFEDATFPEPLTLRTRYASLSSAARNAKMRLDRDIRPKEDLLLDTVPGSLDEEQKTAWTAAFAPQDQAYRQRLSQTGDLLGVNFQRYLKNYLRCVADVDASVGQILDELDQSGLAKNTVVIYSSDQGFFLGENGWYDKRFFYEPSAGTPLLIRVPEGKPRTESRLTADTDLAPTILELAKIKVPREMQGRSILASRRHSAIYAHFYESDDGDHKVAKYVAITTSTHKLICYYELGEWELFDLSRDPIEANNRWADTSLRMKQRELAGLLLREMERLQEDPALISTVRTLVSKN